MILIIESSDEQVLQSIFDYAKPLNAQIRRIEVADKVSDSERERRTTIVKHFRGGLKNSANSYNSSKYEWYLQ
jgi:hypothetical protein